MPQPEAPSETFLLAWDIDVANVIKRSQAEVQSLLFVSPRWHGEEQGWITTPLPRKSLEISFWTLFPRTNSRAKGMSRLFRNA